MVFRTRYSYFKYQVIFFELTNVLAIFQDYVNKILVEKLNIFVIMYLDNILIYIKNKKKKYIEVI